MKPKRTRGQSLTEYLAILGLLVLACVVAIKALGGKMEAGFEKSADAVEEWFAE